MEIPRRDVDLSFDPTTVPRDWCGGDPYRTTYLGALSLLFPEGETFFVQSVKQHRHLVTDPELAREVEGFIGQEAMHGKEHRAFNELLLAHGHAEAPRIEARLKKFLKLVKRVLPPKSQLAVTCALEHFTAMLAEQLLRRPDMRDQLDPQVRALWIWHALEEVEHKAVAFDVYRAAGGGYFRRVAIMILTTIVFFIVHPIVHVRLMARRRILHKPWTWLRGLSQPMFLPLIPSYLSYFRPSFHPGDRDCNELLDQWRTQLFGPAGSLTSQTVIAA